LHEGLNPVGRTPETLNAVEDNANTHDLNVYFPALRAGDLLRFERQGVSIQGGQVNPVLAVFTRTQVIKKGTDFRRLPSALEAGRDYYTPRAGSGAFPTATNIPEDFLVGTSTFVPVPAESRYLMFSLAQPTTSAGPIRVKATYSVVFLRSGWTVTACMEATRRSEATWMATGLRSWRSLLFKKTPRCPMRVRIRISPLRPSWARWGQAVVSHWCLAAVSTRHYVTRPSSRKTLSPGKAHRRARSGRCSPMRITTARFSRCLTR
jgi:hypothetical protein